MKNDNIIDGGNPFNWNRASADYARYRDIYPETFDILHYVSILNIKKSD